jgi:hypothetical protein
MWCLPILEQVPCAAPFDPKAVAVTNTATVFGPRPDLEDFPFDLLLTSRIYGWMTLLSLRSSYQNKLRNHMYPATIGALPWSEALVSVTADLEAQRAPFWQACSARYDAAAELARQAANLPLVPLTAAFKALAAKADKLVLSDEFDDGESWIVTTTQEGSDPLTVVISGDGHSLKFPTEELAEFFRLGVALHEGAEISKSKLLGIGIPQDTATAEALRTLLGSLDPATAEADVLAQVDAIDSVVGAALGLTPDEIAFIQTDMRDDPFLSRVRPRYPFFTPAQRGRRTALESGSRYA